MRIRFHLAIIEFLIITLKMVLIGNLALFKDECLQNI